ncbi:metal-dependent transcriptional regulator [Hoyosella rhizosphaerae]|uniref:metal-dependent transcriptional regulator n=1 Tax=Hoyosella rhizosphaerae TaxID=1755582 RepID=UPI00166F3477|nr:metal-dependent transcriptional regulator [Hoyosella rhizosphaerae]
MPKLIDVPHHRNRTTRATTDSPPGGTSTVGDSGAPRETPPLTPVAQDYLKTIWSLCEWSDERVSAKMLAEKIGVSASTVSESIKKLAEQGLVDHARYGSIALTENGKQAAISMVRRHRLIETFLVRELGYSWDEVHEEAEVLEHAVSDRLVSRIDAKLAYPQRDPHGDPIPTADGSVPTPSARPLSECSNGDSGHIARISDDDAQMLRYFDSVGLALDTHITVHERRDFAGTMSVLIGTAQTPVELGNIAAQAIWLSD